jgi:YVTN family beta-propeller protein
MSGRRTGLALVASLIVLASACGGSGDQGAQASAPSPTPSTATATPSSASPSPEVATPSPSPSASPTSSPHAAKNVYAAIASGTFAPATHGVPTRVYVPDNDSNDVRVIDPKTFKVVRTFAVGQEPQHITPSWNLRHLYVGNVYSNSLTEIDPKTGRPGRTISVPDPYNLYFTPDGKHAIDVAEGHDTLFFYDPTTWKLQGSLAIPYRGPDHMDFSANGRYFLISTEYAGVVVKVQVSPRKIIGTVSLGGSTVDVKVSPDGSVFYVANQIRGGVSVIDPVHMKEIGFIRTGAGAHGFAMARDARHLYVANRLAGTISVIDTTTRKVVKTWHVGGSPDMLQVSADGTQLWTTNRFDASVSVIDTKTGRVLHTIPVGGHPHGLTLFPQPGRYSIGHNGVYR